jgi:hypothetical protein
MAVGPDGQPLPPTEPPAGTEQPENQPPPPPPPTTPPPPPGPRKIYTSIPTYRTIDRELKRQSATNTPASHTLEAIQIAVDALVKNHPNTKLFEVVTAVRADRLKRASHEA